MKPELISNAGTPEILGARPVDRGVNFAVFSRRATTIWVCIFDDADREVARIALDERRGDVHFGHITGVGLGTRYGLRADGPYDPAQGFYFDPEKLLVDPYAKRIDRPFVHDAQLTAKRGEAGDTASLVPKGIVTKGIVTKGIVTSVISGGQKPLELKRDGFVYEVNVRGFTKLDAKVPEALRGTIAGLGHESVVDHFVNLGVDAIELMPVAAWTDERHLPELGLNNAWGYNPVAYFAPDPRLMPGGIADLLALTNVYRAQGIAVILDVVYNHTGESDIDGAVLSLKGLDARAYYVHEKKDGDCRLVNDTGCGNTLRSDHPAVQKLVLESLRYWVEAGGVSGFRFDLAPVLGRSKTGFSPDAELLEAIRDDPLLSKCILIAEPWDPGPGGYQLGQFGGCFSEWNDRYRDDIRSFWRGDAHKLGALATRLSGSADVFDQEGDVPSRGVNFLSAHDGFTLADLVAYEKKHNLANGEGNRDGHNHNLSWNNGVEGASKEPAIIEARKRDVRALLATLFFSRGHVMLGQGDELGRTQGGNNNAYAQDNEITWIDWEAADRDLIDFVGELCRFRKAHHAISSDRFLRGKAKDSTRDVRWLHPRGLEKTPADWHEPLGSVLGMHLSIGGDEVLVWFNRRHHEFQAKLPKSAINQGWGVGLTSTIAPPELAPGRICLPPRSVVALIPKA